MKYIATESIRKGEMITVQNHEMIGHQQIAYCRPAILPEDSINGVALDDADKGEEVKVTPNRTFYVDISGQLGLEGGS